ncbi:MAG: hypothetical protein M1819_004404 [Sarea resinae]|nr:MAG: hypothetical protein M1819_004404 [Sarea resinae]
MVAFSPVTLELRKVSITAANHGPLLNIISWILMVVMCLAVLTVLTTKYIVLRQFRWDDLLITAAMAFGVGQTIAVSVQVGDGLGQHFRALSSTQVDGINKAGYAASLLFIIVLFFAKTSTLLSLHQLTPNTLHRRIILAIAVIVAMWALAAFLAAAFRCSLPHPWAFTSGHCYDEISFWTAIGVVDIVTDLAIIAVPIAMVFSLQLARIKKLAVVFAFSFRLLTVGATICRIAFLPHAFRGSDYTHRSFALLVTTQLEVCLGVFAACIPYLRPYVDSVQAGYFSGVIGAATQYGTSTRNESYAMGTVTSNHGTIRNSLPGRQYPKAKVYDHETAVTSRVEAEQDDAVSQQSSDSQAMIIKQTKEWSVTYTR